MRLNNLIKKILKEETEEWVDVSPEEYKELLNYVNGDGSFIKKLPDYRGKKIRITADLNLSGREDIENIDSIDYVNGNLRIDQSSVKYFDKNKVKGQFSYWGSEMDKEIRRKLREERLEQLSELRNDGAWNIENGDTVSNETEALFDHLMSKGVVEEGEDKYYMFPLYRSDYGGYYVWLGDDAFEQEYFVCSDDNIRDAAKAELENRVEELGYESFYSHVWEDHLNNDEVRRWLYEYFEDDVRYNPEDWNIEKELTNDQKRFIEIHQNNIQRLKKKLEDGGLTDDEVEEIEDDIYDYEQLIEDIKENPEGDYSEEDIEATIERMVDDSVDNFTDFLSERGYDEKFILDFVDMDDLFNYVINSDGYGSILNRYDGDDDEYKIGDTWYHVMREN
jgi:hypothetical protein